MFRTIKVAAVRWRVEECVDRRVNFACDARIVGRGFQTHEIYGWDRRFANAEFAGHKWLPMGCANRLLPSFVAKENRCQEAALGTVSLSRFRTSLVRPFDFPAQPVSRMPDRRQGGHPRAR